MLESGTSNEESIINFGDNVSTNARFIGRITYRHADDSLRFRVNNSERITILNNGNVGIGNTAPAHKLHLGAATAEIAELGFSVISSGTVPSTELGYPIIYGSTSGGSSPDDQAGRLVLQSRSNSNTGDDIFFITGNAADTTLKIIGGSNKVSIPAMSASSDVQTDGSTFLITTSDERLKDIHGYVTYGLNEIMEIKPILFNFKTDPEGSESNIGFSAQNVQKVIPEAVHEDGEGYLGLNSRGIISALVNSIKELKAEIDSGFALNVKAIKELKAENDELRQLICLDHPEAELCQ